MKRGEGLLLAALVFALGSAAKKVLGQASIVALARGAGFRDADLAAAIALAESGGKTWIIVAEPHGGPSYGLWQIHQSAHPEYSPQLLLDPTYNARAAFAISKQGTDWTPWSTFTSGDYKRFLPKGRAA